jgi:nitrite reductase (NADH) small subunit
MLAHSFVSFRDSQMPTRHVIAQVEDVPNGAGKEYAVAGRIIALFNIDGEYSAIDGICAHAGGPIAAGAVVGNVVTCPWHGWQYDVKTGQHCLTESICQQSFPVSVENDSIVVEIPD